jgi:AcrR family transcriptional regulator
MTQTTSESSPRRWRKPQQARSLERVNRLLDVAEQLFVSEGYGTVTTKQIAATAAVPIGTLYQFFPDKEAILQALAERYTDLLEARLARFSEPEMVRLPLADYVQQAIETIDRFFVDRPGYHATFLEIVARQPETDAATDNQLIQVLNKTLLQLSDRFTPDERDTIAFVAVKAVGNLLWIAAGQPPEFRQRLVQETQRLAFHYLNSYLTEDQILH